MMTAMGMGAVLLAGALSGQAAAPAPRAAGSAAPVSEACAANAAPLPDALKGWAARAPLTAAFNRGALGAATLTPGKGVDAALRPADTVAYVSPPGRPAGPGAQAGLLAMDVSVPGTYAVGLSSAAWIDVVDAQGAAVASTEHGHGPACSGMKKVVDFPLAAGRYTVQLTTGGDPVVGVIAFKR